MKREHKHRHLNKRKTLITLIILVLIIIPSIIFLPDFFFHQSNDIVVTPYTVTSSKIPPAFKGYKIAFLSDLHITDSLLYNQVVENCRDLKPDIVVISGDLIDSSSPEQGYYKPYVLAFAKKLSAIAPVYWVTGNYEASISNSDFSSLKNSLKLYDFHYLDNTTVPIIKNNQKINLCGIKDPLFGIENIIGDSNDNVVTIKSYLSESLPQDISSVFTILAAHRTEYCETIAESGIDLLLTGHAHGGQIRIPLIGAVFAPGQGLFPKYTSGQFKIKNTQLIVNRGVGGSRFKLRLFNQPEIVLITL